MNFKYETQGTNTYVVYEIGETELVDSMTLGMITNNEISGLAQAFFFQQDNARYVKYNISSKLSAEQFLMGTVNKKRLIGVFKGIINALISAEEYMIDANSLCLDLDYIYTNVTTFETVVICVPVLDTEKPDVDLKTFFKNIVFRVQFDQTENGDYIAKLINYLNGASAFSLYDFKELLDSIEFGTKPVQTEAKTIQQPTPAIQIQSSTSASAPVFSPKVQKETPVSVSPQSSVEIPKPSKETTMDFAMPVPKREKAVEQPKATDTQPAEAEANEKEISWFYLMQHYNKENAALYKAQKEAKKAAKTSGNKEKQSKKKEKKGKKDKTLEKQPNSAFAIPNQEQPNVPKTLVQPQRAEGKTVPTPVMEQKAAAPVSQMYQMPNIQEEQPVGFGETTVLSNVGIGETTVLGETQMTAKPMPYLIRTKNNEKIILDKPVFRIGKEKSFVDYFIRDNSAISRSHAHIITRDGEYFIQDTNSTNHTYVDGQMIPSSVDIRITHGTNIRLADEEFEFKTY